MKDRTTAALGFVFTWAKPRERSFVVAIFTSTSNPTFKLRVQNVLEVGGDIPLAIDGDAKRAALSLEYLERQNLN